MVIENGVKWATIGELMVYYRKSYNTIRRWVATGIIPADATRRDGPRRDYLFDFEKVKEAWANIPPREVGRPPKENP